MIGSHLRTLGVWSIAGPSMAVWSIAFWAATALGGDARTLPDTLPLVMPADVVQQQLRQVDAFYQRQIAAACEARRLARAAASGADASAAWQQRTALRAMLGMQRMDARSAAAQVQVIAAGADRRVERITVPLADGLAARGLLVTPAGSGRRPVAVVCSDADTWPERFAGADDATRVCDWLQTLLARGISVYVPQSIERTNDHAYCQRIPAGLGSGDSVGKDRRWILYRLGYVVGRTVPGMDVQDVLSAVDYLVTRPDVDAQRIGIAGVGQGGMTALYAAALDSRFSAVVVMDYFASRDACWQEPVDRRLPGQLLQFGDADVASLIAPRALTIVRSSGSSILPDSVQGEAELAQACWSQLHADRALQVVDVPGERGAVDFMAEKLADASRADTAAPRAPGTPVAIAAAEALSMRNQHFEERLAWVRSLIDRSEADRYQRWGLLTRPAADFERMQVEMMADYRRLVGEIPLDGRPLRPRSELVLATDAYRAYRVLLDVTEGVEVYGNLLVPRGVQGPTAAVICQHGLSGRPEMITGLGMTEDTPYHEFGRRLAEQGYVVFAPLLLHQHPVEQVNRQCRQADALGMMRLAMVRAKTERVIDFLQTLPEVDPQRIGYYGLSYGGYSAIWLAPLVERLKAVVVSGHFNDWRSKITADTVATSYLLHPDEDFYSWDILHRFTHVELLVLASPRPICVEFGERDGITCPAWTGAAWQQVCDIETHYGRSGRVELARFDGVHEVEGVQAFAFLDRHLRPARPNRTK